MTTRLAGAAAEFLGTGLLLVVVVGSGIMGERLSGGNMAIALLANSFATGCGLFVLILVFAPVSGAHFNPLVSGLARVEGGIDSRTFGLFFLAQLTGAIAGVALAHAMFEMPLFALSSMRRTGAGQWLAEGVATSGLLLVILGVRRYGAVVAAAAVAVYIAGAYWFTASTSFANPVVTLGRALTPTFAGIAPGDIAGFVVAQLAGAAIAFSLRPWLVAESS